MEEDYKILKSKQVYDGHIMAVYNDKIEMPNHVVTYREYVQRYAPGASAIVPVRSDGSIILVKQYRHPIKRITLELPAGVMDEGEDAITCAARELEEEIGLKPGKLSYLCSQHSAVGICSEEIYIYVAEDLQPGKQNFDADELLEVVAYPLDEIIDMILHGKITDSKTMTGILAYQVWQAKR